MAKVLDHQDNYFLIMYLIFIVLSSVVGCKNTSEQDAYSNKKIISYHENGHAKLVEYTLDSIIDSSFYQKLYLNGNIKEEFTIVNGKREGKSRFYYINGQLKALHNYYNNLKQGKLYVYGMHGKMTCEFVCYEDELVYKKSFFYDKHEQLDSIHEDLGLIIDTNKKSIKDPFFVNEYSAFGIKFPLDSFEGDLSIRYNLEVLEYKDQKFAPYYPDTIGISKDSFAEIGYTFYEPCSLYLHGHIYQNIEDTMIHLGYFGKEFEVIDSTIYWERKGAKTL